MPVSLSTIGRIPRAGETLVAGRLRLLRQLGRGSAGVVFAAHDSERDERLAVKLLLTSDASAIYHLKNEFRLLADLRHHQLVRLHDLFHEGGRWFYTMELVDGEPFDRWVRPDGALDEVRLRSALFQLCLGVKAIHQAGRLHRDLKPSNVLITPTGRVVVLDFGLAVEPQIGGIGQTISDGLVVGTPRYMAPEQAAGLSVSAASDLYAIGTMLFEALTGSVPFEGTLGEVIAAKQRDEAPRPSQLGRPLSEDLDAICFELLASAPESRPGIDALLSRIGAGVGWTPTSRLHEREGARPTLVGRALELQELASCYEQTLSDQPTLVVLSGASGIGKTALCEAFLAGVQERAHGLVLHSRCYERESVPFKAFDSLIDGLSRYLRRLSPADAGALLPREVFALAKLFPILNRIAVVADMPAREIADPQELRSRAFLALGEFLERIRDRVPVIVYIDDMQWACDDSLAALRQLLTGRAPPPLLLLVTTRTGALDARHPSGSVLNAARENPAWRMRELTLEPLSPASTLELCEQLLHAEASAGSSAEVIARESEGNAFLAQELVRFALRGGSFARQSPALSELLEHRLSGLREAARSLLETAALLGDPLQADVLRDASGASAADLQELRDANLVRTSGRRAGEARAIVECYHDRIREELASGLSEARRRVLYARLAAALVRREDPDDELLSRCLELSGDPAAAVRHVIRAAEKAEQSTAFGRAAQLYAKALALGTHDRAQARALHEALGRALEYAGHGFRAAEAYLRAATHLSGLEQLELQRRAAEQWLMTGHVQPGTELLRRVCAELNIALPASELTAALSIARQEVLLRVQESRKRARRVRAHVELASVDARRLRTARTAVIGLIGYLPLQSSSVARTYYRLTLETGDPNERARALGFYVYTLSQLNPVEPRAESLLRRLEETLAEGVDRDVLGFASLIKGCKEFFRAAFPESRDHFSRARQLLRDCKGVDWELDAVNLHDALRAYFQGDYRTLQATIPPRIAEALQRGRVYGAAMLTGISGSAAWLASGDTQGYRRQLDETKRHWRSQREVSWPDFMLAAGEAALARYEDSPERGLMLLEELRSRSVSLVFHVGLGARAYALYSGACAASLLARQRSGRDAPRARYSPARSRAIVERAVKALRHGTSGGFPGMAEIFKGALALHDERASECADWLRYALGFAEARGGLVSRAAIQRRLGQLLGGAEGAALLGAGDDTLRAQGVTDFERTTELCCPGCTR